MAVQAMAVIGGLQLGASLLQGIGSKRKENKRRKQRANYFETELKPLLNEATADPNIDYTDIRNAELSMPTENFTMQMNQLAKNSNATMAQSGFNSSGFLNRDYEDQSNLMEEGFQASVYNVDKGILDMQTQIESLVNQNKLRAKELEYQYLYG